MLLDACFAFGTVASPSESSRAVASEFRRLCYISTTFNMHGWELTSSHGSGVDFLHYVAPFATSTRVTLRQATRIATPCCHVQVTRFHCKCSRFQLVTTIRTVTAHLVICIRRMSYEVHAALGSPHVSTAI